MDLICDLGLSFYRQDGGDWLSNFVSTAFQIVSLVANILGGGSSTESSSSSNTVDRVDAATVQAASQVDDLDYAMGTLMAYGGKYLREMALWAWEYGTQTPVEALTTNTIESSSSSAASSVR